MKIFSSFIILISIQVACIAQADIWEQVIDDGFGSVNTIDIAELKVFKGKIYAFTRIKTMPLTNKAHVWYSSTGDAGVANWTESVSFSPALSNTTDIILGVGTTDFGEGYMYIGTTDTLGGARVYRTTDGLSWTQINNDGFGTVYNQYISQSGLMVYKGAAADTFLYATTSNDEEGGQLWRIKYSDTDPADWVKVLDFGTADTMVNTITWLHIHNDTLYLGTDGGCHLYWSVNGATWIKDTAVGNGFDIVSNTNIASIETFNGYMFIGTGNLDGGQLWKSANKGSWTQVTDDAFGKGSSVWEMHNMRVINDQLWVTGTSLAGTGSPVWKSSDGTDFVQSNADGFGNTATAMGFTITAEFNDYIYWGGQNALTGAQIWRTPVSSALLPDLPGNYNISIFPNPACSDFSIIIPNTLVSKNPVFSVFNIHGQLLLQKPITQEKTNVDISRFSKGIYVIKLNSMNRTEVAKIIKE